MRPWRWGRPVAALLGVLVAHAGAAAPSPGEPLVEFSQALAASLNQRDAALLAQHFDGPGFVDRVVRSNAFPSGKQDAMAAFARQAAAKMSQAIVHKLGETAKVKFLRLAAAGDGTDTRVSLFRIDLGDEGINYWSFQLAPAGAKDVRVVDWVNYSTGTPASEAMATIFELLLGPGPAGAQQAASRQPLVKFLAAYNAGKHQEALALYEALPAWIRRNRYVQICRMESAAMVNEDEYRKALAELAATHGQDRRLSLVLVDHYFYEEDYARAHALLDEVGAMIGGDAALEALHANIAYQAGERGQAVRYCSRSIRQDPDYEDAYWTLLNLLVEGGHYEDAVLTLRVLRSRFGYALAPEEVAVYEGFAEFARSAAFRDWAGN